jgi:hypothetical protein
VPDEELPPLCFDSPPYFNRLIRDTAKSRGVSFSALIRRWLEERAMAEGLLGPDRLPLEAPGAPAERGVLLRLSGDLLLVLQEVARLRGSSLEDVCRSLLLDHAGGCLKSTQQTVQNLREAAASLKGQQQHSSPPEAP